MAISRDSHTASDSAGAVGSLTYSHTCSGSNRLLVVYANVNSASDLLTGITYSGTAMTFVNKIINGAQGTSYIYSLLAPTTGANNIVISISGTSGISGRSASYNGVSQTGFPDAQKTASSGSPGTSFSTTLTTVANNSWIFSAAASDHGVLSGGTNATLLDGGTNTNIASFDSNGAIATAGSTTVSWNSSAGTSNWGTNLVSFAPVAAATVNSGFFFLM